ncbi:hypothetical protein ACFL6C_13000 [Myxococcota bacterium]
MQEYTVQEKKRAISLAMKVGAREAGRRLGIPDGTLTCWCFKARTARKKGGDWPVPATICRSKRRPVTVGRRRKTTTPGVTEPRAKVEIERDVGPRLIAAKLAAEPVQQDFSPEVAWEIETEQGAVLRVRRTISSPELERILAALLSQDSSR